MVKRSLLVLALGLSLLVGAWRTEGAEPIWTGVYYVATDGIDATGDGSESKPWATITHALDSVTDGSLVLVRSGVYVGRVLLSGNFTQGVTVRSETPYQARLRNNDKVITSYDGAIGITLEGFDIAHDGEGAGALVIHLDGGEPVAGCRISRYGTTYCTTATTTTSSRSTTPAQTSLSKATCSTTRPVPMNTST